MKTPPKATPPSPETHDWYAQDIAAVRDHFGTDLRLGLPASDIETRRAQYGWNALEEAPPEPVWKKLLGQFKELVIWILIVAALVSGILGEWADAAAILAIVFVNGVIGYWQEERASRALSALRSLSAPTAKVIRSGTLQVVAARELVPGDRLELEAGDHVAADARILSAFGLQAQEAALTGESVPVSKSADAILAHPTPLGDRKNMVYVGTVVATGKASAIVVATGMQTELGSIAGLLDRTEREPTPLQHRLTELGKVLVTVCMAIVGIIFVIELSRGRPLLDVLLVSVSLAVAAVPEGLPAVVTLSLALGLQRMVARNALVRKLPSVETLGCVTVICSDKTGTLTRNEMTVRAVITASARYRVTGSGYAPSGEFLRLPCDVSKSSAPPNLPEARDVADIAQEPELMQSLRIAIRCNNATVVPLGDAGNVWQVIGDPTEGALFVAAMKGGCSSLEADEKVVFEIPFDSERKIMSVVTRESTGQQVMYTKGAPEMLLGKCDSEWRNGTATPLTETRRAEIMQDNARLAADALRVLALAFRPLAPDTVDFEETHLTFVSLIGMIDPPRDEVKTAVMRCQSAGIRAVMITGDHPATALAIARELHLASRDSRVIIGSELDRMDDTELAAQVSEIAVFARVSAEHKLRVVNAWRARGQIVAMTGDGVNDAPAVHAADIGIAMGVSGTDVTKETSDMVLTDDNFASIVNAIEEGRGIFDNIQKFVHYLLSCNAGEVLLMFFAALVGWPVPLMAIQLLWINLVTDGLPALALGMEPPEPDLMDRPPRPPHEPVITWDRGSCMLRDGCLMAGVAAFGFWTIYQGQPANLARARTVAFCIMAFTQLCYVIACRSQRFTMPQLGLFSNPHLFGAIVISALLQLSVVMLPFAQPVFETAGNLSWEWGLVLGLSILPVTFIEVGKILIQARRQGTK